MTPHPLLLLVGLAIGCVLLGCAHWVYLDARDRTEMRRAEARYWDEMGRIHKRHQHDDRHDHYDEARPE